MEILGGIGMILLAGWQFLATYRAFQHVHTAGDANTAPTIGIGLGYGLFFGVILLVGGIGLLISGFLG